jgi:hypothetical protein
VDLDLEADLVRRVRWHTSIDETPDPCEVELRDLRSGGHGPRLPGDPLVPSRDAYGPYGHAEGDAGFSTEDLVEMARHVLSPPRLEASMRIR